MSSRTSSTKRSGSRAKADHEETVRSLAQFRYALRKFLRFSENAARECGVTPQQHQLMLGVAGYTGRNSATVSELAEFLQERNQSVVGLVERAVQNGLVRRTQDSRDRRVVIVSLTPRGEEILLMLTKLHQDEIRRISEIRDLRKFPKVFTEREGKTG
jgi:DNA-binding MarR family transcriptional regulator